MATPEKIKFSVLREGTQFGDATSVEMTEREAEAFIRAGDIAPFDATLEPAKSKTAARGKKVSARSDTSAARIKQLEAELAAARASNGGDPAALKAAQDAQAVAEAALAEARVDLQVFADAANSANTLCDSLRQELSEAGQRVTEAEDLANEAALETESLERVIAVIAETAPELVTQAKETVAAEYQATSDAQAQPPAGEAS